MDPENIPQQEAEFYFRRLTEPINLGLQALLESPLWLMVFIGIALAALVYLAWMAAREARATGWPWACFRIGSRLLCFLAVAAAALVVRAGVPDSDDSFRLAMHRGAIVFLVVSAALLGLAAVLHYRDDVKTSGPVTASLLTALRLVSYVALAFLFFFLPEAEAGSPVALSG